MNQGHCINLTNLQNLVVSHNITEDGLAAAEDLGGLASPSIAVSKWLMLVGSIVSVRYHCSLIQNILDDKTLRTFDTDIYSSRQPRADEAINLKAFTKRWVKKLIRQLKEQNYITLLTVV